MQSTPVLYTYQVATALLFASARLIQKLGMSNLRFYALRRVSDVYSDDMYNWMHLHHTYKSLEMGGACNRYYIYRPLALRVPRFVVFHCLL